MLQNILHVISNLSLVNEGYRAVGEINSESLQCLFMDMEDMAADILSIYDGFKPKQPELNKEINDALKPNKNQNN